MWVVIGSAINNFLCLNFSLKARGVNCPCYTVNCRNWFPRSLRILEYLRREWKRRHIIAKSTSGCRALGQRAQVSPLPALTFTRILFERPPAPSGLLRPCRGETGPAQTLTGEMTQFCDICETPVQMSNVLSVECQVTGEFVKPEQSMVSDDGDWISWLWDVDSDPSTWPLLRSAAAAAQ